MYRISPLIFVCMVLVGCGDGNPKIVATKGSVKTKSGKPCVGAMVVFHPIDQGRENDPKPVGSVNEDGTFILTTKVQNDGAPIGNYNVTVVWNAKAKESRLQISAEGAAGQDQLGHRYGDPRNPKLKATVSSSSPNEFHFEVE